MKIVTLRKTTVFLVPTALCALSGYAVTGAAPTEDAVSVAQKAPDYLGTVRRFADTLIEKGGDNYGPQKTPMWASVLDTRDWTAPREGVAPPEGIRPGDRALGGSNFYHDAVTTRVLTALSEETKDPRYREATSRYCTYFLQHAQNPQSGLLGWGEHLFYDLYQDKVTVQPDYLKQDYGGLWHELIEWTPPWEELWESDPQAVTKAISGLRYHFYQDNPQSLYNRHANWDRAEHQKPGGQPWIKHSALYAYSFMFLYAKTKDPQWLKWSEGAASLFWDRRNAQINLTLSCIGDPREGSRNASGGMTSLAYWMLKASQLQPQQKELRERSLTLLKAYDRNFYDAKKNSYRSLVALDGTPVDEKPVKVWNFAYGEPSILAYGRIAAYFARTEKDEDCGNIARRIAQMTKATPVPENVSLEGLAFAVNLNLDLYDITGEKGYLEDARGYADTSIARFWVENEGGGTFVRAPRDSYYEAKVGVGDLLSGLLRLDLRLNKKPELKQMDWSF